MIMWFMVARTHGGDQYDPTWLANFIHGWPHISYKTFTKYNSNFDPDDGKYIETLLFWAGMPIVWLGLCIVTLLLFSCCLCLKRNQPVSIHKSITRLRWWIIFMMLLCVVLIGLCFYGNALTSNGIDHYIHTVEKANETMGDIDENVNDIQNEMSSAFDYSEQLESSLPTYCSSNRTILQKARDVKVATITIRDNISEVGVKLNGNLVHSMAESSDDIHTYRIWGWSIFIGLLCVDLVLCISVIFCTGKSIRGGIIFGCILLIIAFTLVWIVAGTELFVLVGLSDFCVNPSRYVIQEAQKYGVQDDVAWYYMSCNGTSPFDEAFRDADKLYYAAEEDLNQIGVACPRQEIQDILISLQEGFDQFKTDFDELKVEANCQHLSQDYSLAILSLCYTSLSGLGYQFLFGAILGMLWLVAICQGTLLASRLGRRKMSYEAEQEDPFLPPREGAATLERYSARRDQPSTSGLNRRPISSTSQSSNALPHFPVIISNRGSSIAGQSTVTVPDDLPPSYTLAISRDRPNRRRANQSQQSAANSNDVFTAASLV